MNTIKINVPDGHEIDLEKSNLSKGEVCFKEVKKTITYEDVAEKLFVHNCCFYTDEHAVILRTDKMKYRFNESNNSTSREQLESILALNKLCNVAKYLNGDWVPDWDDKDETKYHLFFTQIENSIKVNYNIIDCYGSVYFKSKELAEKAIEILGKEEVKKALTLNH